MCPLRRLDQLAIRFVAELCLVFPGDMRGDLVGRRRIYEQTAAAAESAAGKTRPVDLGNRLGRVDDGVKLFGGSFQ